MNLYEYTFSDYDEPLPETIANDIGILQYLAYDLKTELLDNAVHNIWYGNEFNEIKENISILLVKYNCLNVPLLKVFEKDFSEWEEFYNDLEIVFQIILRTNNIKF